MNGTVEALTPDWRGATLVTAVGSVLTVDDVADFDEEGGWLTIADATPLEYVAVDEDADTVTLTGTAGTVEAGDPVVIWDPTVPPSGAKVVEYLASVMTDRGPVDAVIEHEKIPLAGVDTLVGASVSLTEDAYGTPYVDQVLGREPQIDLSYADPTSTIPGGQAFSLDAPTATDGYPEDYGWWQVDATGNVLGFWRLVGGAWTAQTIVTTEALQVGNVLADAINATDMSAVTVTGATVRTSSIDDQGIHLDSKGLRAYGPAGGSPFLDVDPAKGLVIVAGEGTFDKLTTPGELPAGETSAELGGLTQVKSGGKVTLVGGALPPAKAPAVGYTYNTTQFDNDSKWADRYGWSTDGTYWYTVRVNSERDFDIERWNADGTLSKRVRHGDISSKYCAGIIVFGGNMYTLTGDELYGWTLWVHDTTTFAFIDGGWHWWGGYSTGWNKIPALGVDPANGQVLIAQARSQDNIVRIRRYTVPATYGGDLVLVGTFVDTVAYPHDLAGITYGAHDLGANRYIFTARSVEDTFRVVDSTGAAVAAENWQAPARRVGFAYTGGAFVTMDWTGTMRTFTGLEKTTAIGDANLKKWASSTNYRAVRTVAVTTSSGSTAITYSTGVLTAADVGAGISGAGIPAGATIATVGTTSGTISTAATAPGTTATVTWETPQSPRASITVNKRSKLTVTTAGLPATPGANDPNQVQVYVGQGSSNPTRTSMWRQTTPAVGVITAAYSSLVTSGTNPPSPNNFPAATQAILEATTNGFTVDAASNGSVGTGTFRDSVRSAAMGDYAAGTWTTYTPTFTAATTNPTLGNFTRVGRYTQRGKTVTFTVVITATAGTGLGSGTYEFGLPVAARSADEIVVTGAQTGPNHSYVGRSSGGSTSVVTLMLTSTDAAINATNSGMASGTVLRITGTYEAA